MARSFTTIIGLILALALISCATQQSVEKPPTPQIQKLVLAKGVDESGTVDVPLDSTNEFTTDDPQVVALVAMDNMHGTHQLRWEWLTPDNSVYLATKNTPIEVSKGKFLPKTTAWHQISLKDDPAAEIPGQWTVKMYVDDEMFDSKRFVVKQAIDPLALPRNLSSRPYPNDWGLIIGIENYNRLPKVEFARKDALIVRDYFTRILGVPEENIISLIDADATKAQIEGYLKKYIPKNVGKDATLYVYFAGHGMPGTNRGEPYLVPYDADTRFIEQTGYKLISFYQDLNQIKLNRVYVFLDSCFSGVASRAADMLIKGARPAMFHMEKVQTPSSHIISFNASSSGEISNALPEKGHGLFTYYLLRGMRGEADTNDDGWSSIKELYGYVHRNVTRESRRIQSEQTPIIVPPPERLKDVSLSRNINR